MRVLPKLLAALAPPLGQLSLETVANYLTQLGFETEILPGQTPVLDVSITPNRADAMSHLGLARDLDAYLKRNRETVRPALQLPDRFRLLDRDLATDEFSIQIKSDVATQYHAIVLDHVVVSPSPAWLVTTLTQLGIRPINQVVDLTNYLMELYGQPLHAFDADAIVGKQLIVRPARSGERIRTIDGTEHILKSGVTVIGDDQALIDLAGIQGGANSQITSKTTRVLLQSAIFNPARIRRATTLLQHRTAASARYERGIDPAISWAVLGEAVDLLKTKDFGRVTVAGTISIRTQAIRPIEIPVSAARVNALIGLSISGHRQQHVLTRLGCTIQSTSANDYQATPPSWRCDFHIWQDAAEEVIRLIGIDTVSGRTLGRQKRSLSRSMIERGEAIKDRLVEIGLCEVQTYSFISASDIERFALKSAGEIANPLNPALRFLRPSLLPGLTRVIARNGLFDPIAIFELGHVFSSSGETIHIGIGLASQTKIDTAWVVRLADAVGLDSATLLTRLSVTKPSVDLLAAYKIRKQSVSLIEFSLDALDDARRIPAHYHIPSETFVYRPLSKFPPVVRDVAVVVDRTLSADVIVEHLKTLDPRIELVELFDHYISPKLGPTVKSLAFHLYYADATQTLTDEDVGAIHKSVVVSLQTVFQATIR
ncbi:phenylalanine--tRNA ligase subunit beta [Candidatus Berkelbacteria bacterium]|nr:phenylalanine--tRNA ligase subunit beta [Candidatus Berkelbacteria bacterium]